MPTSKVLGVKSQNIIYSDYTSSELYRAGSSRGAIDPCFPAKIGIAHVHNLLSVKHAKKKLNYIFFPMVDVLHSPLVNLAGINACPTVTATPETVKAAFTKENDVFAEAGVAYVSPVLNFTDRKLLGLSDVPGVGDPYSDFPEEENERAIEAGFKSSGRL